MVEKSEIIKEAQKYLAKGQIDKAIAEWEKLTKEGTPDGAVYNTIGDLYLKKGDKKHSVEAYHKASQIFREGGFSLKALALYKKILNINPVDADALFALGELNEEKHIVTDAIKYYLAASDIFSKENKKEKLLASYEKILGLAPNNIPLRVKISEMFSKEGFVSEAAREFISIGLLYLEQSDIENAKKYILRALEIQPGNADALIALSRVYEKSADTKEAIKALRAGIESSGGSPELFLTMGRLLIEDGSYEEAKGYIEKALEAEPNNLKARRMLGDIALKRGDNEKAWEHYNLVLEEMIFKGDFTSAISVLNSFKEIKPIDSRRKLISLYNQMSDVSSAVDELTSLAVIYEGMGQPIDALKCYQEALALRPDDLVIKENISTLEAELGVVHEEEKKSPEEVLTEADIFLRYGLYDEARTALEALKVDYPENIDLHLKLKTLYLDTGDKEQAVTECLILSELYGRVGDSEKKEAFMAEALEINPDDPRLSGVGISTEKEQAPPSIEDYAEELSEAEFYARQGLIPDALDIYRRLYNIFPDNTEIEDKIKELQGMAEPSETISPVEMTPPSETLTPPSEETHPEEVTEPSETISLEEIVPEPQEIKEPELESEVLEIFEEFKKGLAKDIEAEDYETHYNLGIAYKEMGLIDDAITEFQNAKKDPKLFVQSSTILGMCYMQKGLYQLAIDAFTSALMKIESRDDSYWSAKYDLAEAYEKNGNLKEALQLYTEVFGWNAKFRDVAEKVNRLKAVEEQKPEKISEVSDTIKKKNRVSYI